MLLRDAEPLIANPDANRVEFEVGAQLDRGRPRAST